MKCIDDDRRRRRAGKNVVRCPSLFRYQAACHANAMTSAGPNILQAVNEERSCAVQLKVTGNYIQRFVRCQSIELYSKTVQQGRRHGVDWDGHVHSTFARGCS